MASPIGALQLLQKLLKRTSRQDKTFDKYQYSEEGCRFTQRKFVATFLPGSSGAPAQTTNTAK